jgi:D-tyrosyl-tRNA(Tyr) deacylase
VRAVVQRVEQAAVSVLGEAVGEIGEGLLVLVGVGHDDDPRDAQALAKKLVGLRVFSDDQGRMNRSITEAGGAMLVVSQFTLLADLHRGRRPSFVDAAAPDVAEPLVEEVARFVAGRGVPVATGTFGAHMKIELVNDGPVTIIIDVVAGKVS